MSIILFISVIANIILIWSIIYNLYNKRCYIEELYEVLNGNQRATSIEYDKISLDFGESLGKVIRSKNIAIQDKDYVITKYKKMIDKQNKDSYFVDKLYTDITKHKRQK